MLNNKEHIAGLIVKFLQGGLSKTENKQLQEWISESPENKETFELSTQVEKLLEDLTWYQQSKEKNWKELNKVIGGKVVSFTFRKLMPYAAAVLVLILATASYMWVFNKKKPAEAHNTISAKYKNDILPANGRAILTLDGGQKVILDSTTGIVAKQGNTQIINNTGQLVIAPSTAQAAIVYNSVNTENGGIYSIVLSDGTIAWLNAASSLTFPNAFTGIQRKVEITGEVYFEVAKDAAKPFIVSIKTPAGNSRGEIEVLGTHFNVNAYDDNSIVRATLLEGSVKVSNGNKSTVINPNQQAQISNDKVTVINDPDIDQTMAWKNGLFFMAKQDIKSIMEEVQRWYNVEVEFAGTPITGTFSGKISRKEPVSKLLMILELTEGVRFEIVDNKIIVMSPKR
jgi:transmembrane sensor